jgi:hypothetical protein
MPARGGAGVQLLAGDLAYGVVEGQSEHAHEEVDGIAGLVALGPAPVTVLEDQARISRPAMIALGGWWRSTAAGTPGTWKQIVPAAVTDDP